MSRRSIRASFNSDLLKQPLLPISMLLIFSYLYFNAFYEGYSINDNLRTADCCITKDKKFYCSVFWIHCGLWAVCVILVYIFLHCWKCENCFTFFSSAVKQKPKECSWNSFLNCISDVDTGDADHGYFMPFTDSHEKWIYYLLNTAFASLRFITSLFLLPLLFLQMLSCYQWTCLFSRYCAPENQYRLSLVQAVISFCFILSGFLSSFSAKVAAKPTKTIYATISE